jgi:hypothetical protein
MGIQEVAAELYGLPPEEFTAARNTAAAEAKSSGDAELAAAVKVLRKPSVGAWLLNQLVRQRGDEVEQVLELGARLRAAQGTLGAAELRSLDTQRRALTRAVAGQAVSIGRSAGRTISAAVSGSVEETLRSAMVDTDAGAALSTGLLVDTFSASGLDPVDLSRVVAVGGAAPRARRSAAGPVEAPEPDPKAVAAARKAVERAEGGLRSAREAAEEARNAGVAARRRRDEVESELEKARRAVEALEEKLAAAVSADEDARRRQHTATRDERSAVEAAQKAQRALESLLDGR